MRWDSRHATITTPLIAAGPPSQPASVPRRPRLTSPITPLGALAHRRVDEGRPVAVAERMSDSGIDSVPTLIAVPRDSSCQGEVAIRAGPVERHARALQRRGVGGRRCPERRAVLSPVDLAPVMPAADVASRRPTLPMARRLTSRPASGDVDEAGCDDLAGRVDDISCVLRVVRSPDRQDVGRP